MGHKLLHWPNRTELTCVVGGVTTDVGDTGIHYLTLTVVISALTAILLFSAANEGIVKR